MCRVYAETWSAPVTSLRYFTVYGPRQRPDMAIHQLCEAALNHTSFPLFGDGEHVRDFAFVADVVAANLAAADADTAPGETFNVSGGGAVTMLDVVAVVSELVGEPIDIEHFSEQAGDVRRTGGDNQRARSILGWEPLIDLNAGLARQVDWHRSLRRRAPIDAL